jgi:hypothetical protein
MQELSLNGLHEGNGSGSNLAVMVNTSILILPAPHCGHDVLHPWNFQGQANLTQRETPFDYLHDSFRQMTFCVLQTQAAFSNVILI